MHCGNGFFTCGVRDVALRKQMFRNLGHIGAYLSVSVCLCLSLCLCLAFPVGALCTTDRQSEVDKTIFRKKSDKGTSQGITVEGTSGE